MSTQTKVRYDRAREEREIFYDLRKQVIAGEISKDRVCEIVQLAIAQRFYDPKKVWNKDVIKTLKERMDDEMIPEEEAYKILDKKLSRRLKV